MRMNNEAEKYLLSYLPKEDKLKKSFIEGYSLSLKSQGGTIEDIYSHADYPGSIGPDCSKNEIYNTLMEYHNMCCPFKKTCTYSDSLKYCVKFCNYQKAFKELIDKIIKE